MVDTDDRQDGGQTQDAAQTDDSEANNADQQNQTDQSNEAGQESNSSDTQSETQQQENDESADQGADQNDDQDEEVDEDTTAVPENTQSADVEEGDAEAEEEDQPDAKDEQPQHYAREQLRAEIETKAGDSQSILGTTADATQLLLLLVSRVLRALDSTTDPAFASIKTELAPFALIAKGFLDKVETGQVKMPALVKGLEAVVAEIEDRSTKVASVIEEHKSKSAGSDQDAGDQ